MSRRITRARPLDPYKRVLVSDDPSNLFDEEEEPSGAGKRKTIVALPTPGIQRVLSYEQEHRPTYAPPSSFIRYRPKPFDDHHVEYDLQFDDEYWLKNHPKWGSAAEPRQQLAPEHLEALIDLLEKESAKLGSESELSQPQAVQLALEKLHLYNGSMVEDVYKYWQGKRSRLHKPLLRCFWPATSIHDTYKLRKHRKNDMESYHKLQQLREDLVRAKQLMQTIRQRELLKREVLNVLVDSFEQERHDITNYKGVTRNPPMLARHAEIKEKLYPKNLTQFAPPTPAQHAHPAAAAEYGFDEPDKATRSRPRQQRQRRPRQRVPRPPPQLPVGFQPGWWHAPDMYMRLPTATTRSQQDPMQLGVAMGLPLGTPWSLGPTVDLFPGRAVSHSGLRPRTVDAAVARNARSTMGRLGFFASRGWEEAFNLVTGIGGSGPFGEGWDTLGTRPEQRPPPLSEVAPDLDVIGFIRSRRADKHHEQQLNRLALQYQRQASQLAAAAAAGKVPPERAMQAKAKADEAQQRARAVADKNALASSSMRDSKLLSPMTPVPAGRGGAGAGAGAGTSDAGVGTSDAGAGVDAGAALKSPQSQPPAAPSGAASSANPATPSTRGPPASLSLAPSQSTPTPATAATPGGTAATPAGAGVWGPAPTPVARTPFGVGGTAGSSTLARKAFAAAASITGDGGGDGDGDLSMGRARGGVVAEDDDDADTPSACLPPARAGVHRPGYYCRPRVGRGGRVIIDRIPITHTDAHHHAAAWLALTERNRSKQLLRGEGVDQRSNRWAWRHSRLPDAYADPLHPINFHAATGVGPRDDLRRVPTTADAWAHRPDAAGGGDSDDDVDDEDATAGLRGVEAVAGVVGMAPPKVPLPGSDLIRHMVTQLTSPAPPPATALAAGVPMRAAGGSGRGRVPRVVYGVPDDLAPAVSDGGGGARTLGVPVHAAWRPTTHDGYEAATGTGLDYAARLAVLYKEKKSSDRSGADDKEEAHVAVARELVSGAGAWQETDVDGLFDFL